MRTVFEIIPEQMNPENCSLFCELSPDSFSYAIRENDQNKILSVGVYQYEKNRPPSGFSIALQILFHQHKVLTEKFKKTCLTYSLPQSVLMPFAMYNSQKNEDVLSLLHGDFRSGEVILTDLIPGSDLYNVYSASKALHDTIYYQFPATRALHQYSYLLKNQPAEQDRIGVFFYSERCVLFLIQGGQCKLINSYTYRTPEDVAYILLSVRDQFDAGDIPILAGGFIEENSALFKTIYNYFTSVEFFDLPHGLVLSEEVAQYPAHFFYHLYHFDVCE